jgi:uncharacterized cupredoxin-like copper-binding protein
MAISAVAGLVALTQAGSAGAATVIKVDLWDKMSDGMAGPMASNLAYGAPNVDISKAAMGIKADQTTAPAGVVSFKVTNSSKDMAHEMVVLRLAQPGAPLPYKADENKVDEDKAGYKGEAENLDPGKTGSVTLALQPGKYLLICNEPGHFVAGMWTAFEVTK